MMKLKDYIGKDKKPFIIAEMSGNLARHNGALRRVAALAGYGRADYFYCGIGGEKWSGGTEAANLYRRYNDT